jgi:hypothetical protein
MKKFDFIKMKEIEEEKDMDQLNIGDWFLYGKSLIAQKENKIVGQAISYYEIVDVDKSHSRVEYKPVFDYMEEDDNVKKGE